MIWRVEIKEKDTALDALGKSIEKDIHDLGFTSINKVRVSSIYTIDGEISESEIKRICEELLTDRVTQDYICSHIHDLPSYPTPNGFLFIELAYHPWVMDPVEESTLKGIRDLGIAVNKELSVRTAKKFYFFGNLTKKDLNFITDKLLSNKLIQQVVKDPKDYLKSPSWKKEDGKINVLIIDLMKATSRQLLQLSQKGQLFLNLAEMRAIQGYFKRIGRNPTDCELETIAQTWSEHCYHKTFKGDIHFEADLKGGEKRQLIRNLFKSTIVKVTRKLKKPWCVSVFHDNAGVIRFDEDSNICFKVETHNHPSALEPFGGANTGIGGVIRDILGTGLGAKPICSTNVFCFAPPDFSPQRLPEGTLHPKRVMKGVVSGVRDYGNKMGIPTVNGAILFEERFVGNPLVYCGTVGLIPKGKEKKKIEKGDLIVVVGGGTGRDGIHGATFSSGELTNASEEVSSGAVQIGHPIQEKKLLDALLQARDQNLYEAITDCGAGGFSSAIGEMAKDTGARVSLEKIPLKYEGLTYTEIWISESQERMVLAVKPESFHKLNLIFSQEGILPVVIGEFTGNKRLELFYENCQVCDLDMAFLHQGIPRIVKRAQWSPPRLKERHFPCPLDLTQKLLDVLSHYNVCSKEWVIRQYDHEVQGGCVIKPLVGLNCDGPSDASVILPKLDKTRGIAVSNGINFRYGMIDPFWMAGSCIDEAIRQIIAVGGNLERIALLDNFCWGNPDKPDRLGSLVRCAQGCYQIAYGYKVPFISGKDSLNNEYTIKGKSMAIPGTLLISAIGIIEDVTQCVTMDFKKRGDLVYIVGLTQKELGGSIYYDTLKTLGRQVPVVDVKQGAKIYKALTQAVNKGLIEAMHDCSEGGLGVALAEMAFAGGLGLQAHLNQVPYRGRERRNDFILFSESNSRFIIEVKKENQKNFERLLKNLPFGLLGYLQDSPEFVVYGINEGICIKAVIQDLKESWQRPLRF